MRAQLAIEFVFLVSVAFLILIVYTASARSDMARAESVKEHALVKDMGYSLQSEVSMVSALEDGYIRGFSIPATLDGIPYNITILNTTLIVNTSNYEHSLPVPSVLGNLTPGANEIKKVEGKILINQ